MVDTGKQPLRHIDFLSNEILQFGATFFDKILIDVVKILSIYLYTCMIHAVCYSVANS